MKFYIGVAVFLMTVQALYGQAERRRDRPMPAATNIVNRTIDVDYIPDSERTERFYDSLRSKTTRRGFPSVLYSTLFRRQVDTTYTGRFVDESRYFELYQGRTIANIELDRAAVYDQSNNKLKKHLNNTHVLTRRKVIRRDLLFRTGDRIDAQQLVNNKQILLYRPYMAEVTFEIIPNPHDSMLVDVVIHTRDKWSIGIDGRFRSRGRSMLRVYDDNVLGTGNHLGILTNFDRHRREYKGIGGEYNIPNIMGSFYEADFYAGAFFYDRIFQGSVYKNFINPTDYELGFAASHDRLDYYMLYLDNTEFLKRTTFDFWTGKSLHLKNINSSIYFTGRYSYAFHHERPPSTADYNTYFNNHNRIVFGLGLYREKFYAANMIYGYGFQEYLAAGYRAELTGGYNWGEFRDDYYVGLSLHKGGFHRLGFFRAGVDVGTFIGRNDGKLWQSALDVEFKWYSNLFKVGRSSLRQFVTLNHTRGWNRGTGSNEVVRFTKEHGPRTIREWSVGRVRSVLNTESVFFTPYKPVGFRVAVFGWADFATIGNNNNIFRNSFYNTFGVGVRLKNERLTFSAIEIKIGAALGKGGFQKNQWFNVGSEQRVMYDRFLPTVPDVVSYD
ncbi:MAG: hypothetical protein LUE26_09235 [Alistipes sp.]|nr:hypothetical protein [Alistipes sp.]